MQERITEIKKHDGELIAFARYGGQADVKSTKNVFRITYTLVPNVPEPNRKVAKAFGIKGGLEGVIIIDKKGRIRYKDFTDDHSSSSLIIRELKGI